MEMKSLNKVEENNFITENEQQKHTIKKYEFQSIDRALEAQITPSMEEKGFYIPEEIDKKDADLSLEQFEKLLEQNEKILQALANLQEQLSNQDSNDALSEELKNSAYEKGYIEGEKTAQESLQKEVENQKEKMIFAIQKLQDNAAQFQEQIKKISQDLNIIALDLAKEVIIKEVEENHRNIALLIANELLEPLRASAEITIKANPLDLPFLQEKISQDFKITFEADPLVAKGGVMIVSTLGSFDGSILARYKNLKRNILEEKGL